MTAPAPHPTGLHLFTSNRLETLADKLAAHLRAPLASPLQPEIIVVRNKGMERWLKLQLAARHGVCACSEFPFPEAFGQRVFRAVLPDLSKETPLDRETLAWRIAQVLPQLMERPEFTPVRGYLGDAGDERKLLQLSGKLANLFDQYLVFRPELILAWDAGVDPQWQAGLWRAVSADARGRHVAALWQRFTEAVAVPDLTLPDLPERVSVFGISALPPFHLGLLAGLSHHRRVNLFLLQPSQEYWGDITSPREDERILRRHHGREEAPFELHLEPGNRLLASLGYLGRDFLKLVLGSGDWISDEDFTDPGEDSLLHCIQSDILHLRDRGRTGAPIDAAEAGVGETPPAHETERRAPARRLDRQQDRAALELGAPAAVQDSPDGKHPVSPSDDSVQIHSCHSPLREMEILHDRMLDWFGRDPRLAPRDIIVMMPDVEAYAPFIQAVFGSPEDESRRIPFSLADRGARGESHVIDTFLNLLALPDTRLGSATVLAPLETPAVRERFSLSERALETLRDWVRAANIRWGIDAAHREALGLPAFAANTWRAGLDRLLLGRAMAGRGERLFAGILPFDDIEGDAAETAGQLAEYMERLFEWVRALEQPRPLDEWAGVLDRALDDFFKPSEGSERELQILRGQLEILRRQRAPAGFTRALGRAALLERLRPALEEDLHHAGFLTGRVTFCGFKPMRSIPFKIVCLVGMDDGAFPRPTQRLSFDLMAQSPRLGDRSTREDDRYLFLETLLSARHRLYLSYLGQSVRDNRPAPPSVLISELLDYIEQGFKLASGAPGSCPARSESNAGTTSLRDDLLTRHRLQAFHDDYFTGANPAFFSYSAENCRASTSARHARRAVPPFLEQPLAESAPEFRRVSLDDLARFFTSPAKFFLRQRLGIVLPETPEELDEREPVLLNGLGHYQLRGDLLQRRLSGRTAAASRPSVQAAGALPPGSVGDVDFAQSAFRAEAFAARLEAIRLAPPSPFDLSVAVGEFLVTGRIHERTAAGPLSFRCGRLRARDVLCAWLAHLAANGAEPGQTTTLLCEDARRDWSPPADAPSLLAGLLELYWQGLRSPLKFFPGSALKFAEAERAAKQAGKPSSAFDKARGAWEGDTWRGIAGERDDAAFDLCFRHADPLDDTFAAHACGVFGPALELETRRDE